MTFLSGFAEGFIGERKRRLDREAEKEDMAFKYQMQDLTDKKTQRDKRKLQEVEWANQAKIAAREQGDPSFATEAYNYLASGRNFNQLLDDVRGGNFKKDPNYKQPTQTIQMNIPQGVDTSMEIEKEEGYVDPVVSAPNSKTPVDPFREKVNKRIDEVAPGLRDSVTRENPPEYSASGNSGWIFEKKNQIKLGDYGDSLLKLEKARQSGDLAAVREAQTEIKIHQTVLAEQAKAKAKAEGKNVSYYMSVGKDGVVQNLFTGEVRDSDSGDKLLYNISNPIREEAVTTDVIRVDDDAVKEYQNLAGQFDKANSDYNAATDQFMGALTVTSQIEDVLKRNPSVTTYSASGVQLVNQLQDEAKGLYQVLQNQESDIEKSIKSGNVQEVERKISEYEKDVQSMLSVPNKDLAFDKAMYDTLRKLAAFKYAAANGVSGNGMSDKDYNEFYQATGGSKSATAVMSALYNNAASVFSVLDSTRISLDNNNAVKTFEKTYLQGKKSGLSPIRMQDKIMQLGPERSNQIMPIFKSAYENFKIGTRKAVQSSEGIVEESNQPVTNNIPKAAIDYLKSNPNLREQFDKKYGAGVSKQILGE